MSSRKALGICLSLAAFTAVACAAGVSQATSPPNIVLVLADDLNRDCIGCYGNQQVQTPNIDRLATQGMRFTNAYTATAMCSPSRQQLYTGMYPVRSGAYPNHSRIRPGVKTIVNYLAGLGYRVGINGKKHFGPAESYPFEAVGNERMDFAGMLNFLTRDPEQPFCLVVGSSSPHVPWKNGDASRYHPERLSIPPYLADTNAFRRALARYYGEVTDLDREVGECMRIVERSGQSENTMLIFSSEQGAQFPGCKWTCYEPGLAVGFIVRWPRAVKPGTTSDAMVHYVDFVPTMLEAAGAPEVKGLDGRSFLNVLKGHATSHRSLAYGVHTQKGAIGSPETGYPVRSIREGPYKLILNLNHRVKFNTALTQNDAESYWQSWVDGAKTDPHIAKLVQRYLHRPPVEFYNLSEDPHELDNQVDNPQYQTAIANLTTKLKAWMARQGDHGQKTELAYSRKRKPKKK